MLCEYCDSVTQKAQCYLRWYTTSTVASTSDRHLNATSNARWTTAHPGLPFPMLTMNGFKSTRRQCLRANIMLGIVAARLWSTSQPFRAWRYHQWYLVPWSQRIQNLSHNVCQYNVEATPKLRKAKDMQLDSLLLPYLGWHTLSHK